MVESSDPKSGQDSPTDGTDEWNDILSSREKSESSGFDFPDEDDLFTIEDDEDTPSEEDREEAEPDLEMLGMDRKGVSGSIGAGFGFLKSMGREFINEIRSIQKGDDITLPPFTVPKMGIREMWMLFSFYLLIFLAAFYYPLESFWYDHFSIFNWVMFAFFFIIVAGGFLLLLAAKPQTRRLQTPQSKWKTAGKLGVLLLWLLRAKYVLFFLGMIMSGALFFYDQMALVFGFSTITYIMLCFIIATSRGVSRYERLRLIPVFIGIYFVVIVPVHEGLDLASWGFRNMPMDWRNEIMIIGGSAFLLTGISLLRERIGYFTIWLMGHMIVFLIVFHEAFQFNNTQTYEPFDRALAILGAALVIAGDLILLHKWYRYKQIEETLLDGLSLFNGGKFKEALKDFREVFWMAEGGGVLMDFDLIWSLIGNVHFKLGEFDKAIAHYNMALQVNPNNPTVHNDLGNTFFYLRNYRRSMEAYDRALKLDPTNPIIHHNKALVLYSLGRFEEALPSLDKALELKPDFDLAWKDKGMALVHLERYSEAIQSFQEAITINERNEAWFEMGRVFFYRDEYEQALDACENSIKHYPDNDSGYLGKALSLMNLSRFREAEGALLKALEVNEKNPRTWDRLGNVKYALDEHDAAIQAFKRAIKLQPDFGNAKFNLARALKMSNRVDEALDAYDTAVRNRTKSPQQKEKFNEARHFYERVRKADPRNYKPWLYMGDLYFKLGHYRTAVKEYERSLKLKGDDPKTWNLKGIALKRLASYDSSFKAFKRAVELDPGYSEAYMNMGNVYHAVEQYTQAVQYYNKALEIDPENRQVVRNRRISVNKLRRSQRVDLIPTTGGSARVDGGLAAALRKKMTH